MSNAILVITHKKCEQQFEEPYKLIAVGSNKETCRSEWVDDKGDNIAEKNSTYCELTALYWFWKNEMKNYNYVGLCHYRRFFCKNYLDVIRHKILRNKDIEKSLYDEKVIILPKQFKWDISVERMYYERGNGRLKDLQLTRKVLKEMYPEYLEYYDDILSKYSASYCNMFIMNCKMADSYCEWLFDVLSNVEKQLDTTGYSFQELRVYGYLSEILLNVWVKKNSMIPIYYPMLNMEHTFIMNIKIWIKEILRK